MVSGGIVDNSVIADGTGSREKPNVRTLSCALGVASKSPGSGGVEEMNQLEISYVMQKNHPHLHQLHRALPKRSTQREGAAAAFAS